MSKVKTLEGLAILTNIEIDPNLALQIEKEALSRGLVISQFEPPNKLIFRRRVQPLYLV